MKLIKPVHFLDLRHKWWPRQEHGHFRLLSHWLEGPSCPGSPLSLLALGHSSQDTSLRCWPDPRCSLPHRRSSFPALLLVGCSEVPLAEWAFQIFSPATGMSAVPLAPHSNKREWSGRKVFTSKISMKLSYTRPVGSAAGKNKNILGTWEKQLTSDTSLAWDGWVGLNSGQGSGSLFPPSIQW